MRALAALLLLGACTATAVPPAPPVSLRNVAAPIGSQVNVTAADLTGDWMVRQILAENAFRPGYEFGFARADSGLSLQWEAVGCSEVANLCESFSANVDYAADGPGRWVRTGSPDAASGAPARFWILWTDIDRRTLAIGDPKGSFAMIIDRRSSGGDDRIIAAREILDWYGFDVADLVDVRR